MQVIDSSTTAHDTRDHQENMKRTVLLSGVDGCLRREPLQHYIHWDETAIGEASVADILR